MNEPNEPGQHRATFLPMMLGALAAGFFCLVMILITGGFFFYVLGVLLLFVLLGMFHYALWGKAMTDSVASQREEVELLERAKEEPKAPNWTYRR